MCTTRLVEGEEMEKKKTLEEEVTQEIPILQPLEEDVIEEIEMILQYRFENKMLLAQAFTQSSFNNPLKKAGKSYERLEFIGDSVLGCLMTIEVFFSYEDLPPGQLMPLKAANVDTERLARIAVNSSFHKFIRHHAPQLEWQIKEFMKGMNQYPIHSNGLLDPPKALANIVESVIGAIFVDSNNSFEIVWKIFKKLADPLISLDTLGKHPVSELNELCQKNRMNVSYEKDTWMKSMTVQVFVDGNLYGSGTYGHKKEIAQNRAAKAALDRLKMILQKAYSRLVAEEEMEKKKILEEEVAQEDPILQPLEEDVIEEIEMILQYRFGNKMLLAQAFTQSSFNNPLKKAGKSYERLEFIGDSVLGCLMATEVFFSYEDLPPGQLTLLKAANVDTERLARIAVKSHFHKYIRHNAPQLEWQIKEFMEGMNQYPIHSNGLLDPPKALANIVESVIGAIFVDSNKSFEIVWKIFKKLADPLISHDTLGKHPVSELNELCQKNRMNVSYEKDTWTKSMTVQVFVDGNLYGSGTYGHKKEIAQNRAAKAALDKLKMIHQKA